MWKTTFSYQFLTPCAMMYGVWNRLSREYLKSPKERHNMKHKSKQMIKVKLGDVVLIGDSERNRGKRNMGIVVKLFQGRDGVVRAVRLRAE